jgi:MobA/VirD2-like, nuclease domain
MNRSADSFISDWGEKAGWGNVKVKRRGQNMKNVRGGNSGGSTIKGPQGRGAPVKAALLRTVKRTPEVMVKVTGGGRNMKRIKAHFDYVSRNGDVGLENENGDIFHGRADVKDLRDIWANTRYGIPEDEEKRREAFNIILSMPPGTDRRAVTDAAREFAADQFENHQYIFATHEDEKHPHVHLSVKAVDKYGGRLNPRKADLQNWREVFAEKLRDNGVEANATNRMARGVVRKGKKQAVKHVDRGYRSGKRKAPSRASQGQLEAALNEAQGGEGRINPAQEKINKNRETMTKAYGSVARSLSTSDKAADKQLALNVVRFVQSMPPKATKHELQVSKIRSELSKQDLSQEREKGGGPDITRN